MKTKKFIGKLIAIDMYNCSEEILNDIEKAKEGLLTGSEDYNMCLHSVTECKEEGKREYSVSALCQQGHVTLHCYPDMGFMTADVFTCNENADPAGMARFLRIYFNADKSKITLVDRGDFGSESDMKPSRQSTIKFSRRTKNLGGKLKKIMLKPRSI